MAAQAALIADTIVGMKRALRKESDFSGPDDPIAQPTNRGNKLRTNAKHVREGALGYIQPEDLYKQRIEHAGYTRYILQSNPVRYDSEGDELDEDDEDSEADAAAAEENPFSDIALENFLCPLKHPSELPTHPSLSHAYTSPALLNMTKAIEAKLRQERTLLWHARNLHRLFLGDSSWMPCGSVETPQDRWIFEPRLIAAGRTLPAGQHGQNGVSGLSEAAGMSGQSHETLKFDIVADASKDAQTVENEAAQGSNTAGQDVEMTGVRNQVIQSVDPRNDNGQPRKPKSEEAETPVGKLPQHPDIVETRANGSNTTNSHLEHPSMLDSDGLHKDAKKNANDRTASDDRKTSPNHEDRKDVQGDEADKDEEMQDGLSPEPPRRMTTRAQANATNSLEDESGNLSSSPSSDTLSSLPIPHPLFLVPDYIRADPDLGLSPMEAEDTRRLLWSYVQKQEETVRGFEHMLECLLRACRMKDDVLEWCKAEGHVGEMSDGEDWYDREKWGLGEGEDLKKGADEDEIEMVEESRASNKRGRGRRA
ncbi:RXT2-like protein [Aspergillus coremiiformis]|uniref:RXT2-like protein n=1 Tax=Aspergillus coremiiformis TaxID=138285 RepID=A0A5N6ZAJ9_9EURO|nr:RXT2-like protein [Aspergillus coremiiformis]